MNLLPHLTHEPIPSSEETAQELALAARRVDELARGARELFREGGSFAAELALARAVAELRTALSPELMAPILSLMNSDLGFRTDRDPARVDGSTGKPFEPYPVEIVRECFIESRLRGFHACGNEWNILNGRFYACKNGFRRKLTDGKTFPGLTELKDWYDVPRLVGDRGAIVRCRAEWVLFGRPDALEREFPIRMALGIGVDAILGKAERRLLRAVHDRLLGLTTPEAEVGDESGALEAESLLASSPPPLRGTDAAAATPSAAGAAGSDHGQSAAARTPQQALAALLTANGFSFRHLQLWGEESGNLRNAQALSDFNQMAVADCVRLLRNPHGLLAVCAALKARTQAEGPAAEPAAADSMSSSTESPHPCPTKP